MRMSFELSLVRALSCALRYMLLLFAYCFMLWFILICWEVDPFPWYLQSMMVTQTVAKTRGTQQRMVTRRTSSRIRAMTFTCHDGLARVCVYLTAVICFLLDDCSYVFCVQLLWPVGPGVVGYRVDWRFHFWSSPLRGCLPGVPPGYGYSLEGRHTIGVLLCTFTTLLFCVHCSYDLYI